MTEQIATNVHWHHGEISRADRYRVLGQKGATLWFTGFSGSGKSTVAVALEAELLKRGRLSYRLDRAITPASVNSLAISPMRRMFSVRSAAEKPRFLLMPRRMLSPSRR